MIFELAHHMALVPLLVLCVRWAVRGRPSPAYWWLAAAFAVSWFADWAGHWQKPIWPVSSVYPIPQAAIVLAVLTRNAWRWTVIIVAAGLTAAILGRAWTAPDLFLRAVAWGAIVTLVWPRTDWGVLRWALLVYFGGGLVAWAGYALAPAWATWGAYQGCRAAGLGLFSWAAMRR